jgi:hypothetical protein
MKVTVPLNGADAASVLLFFFVYFFFMCCHRRGVRVLPRTWAGNTRFGFLDVKVVSAMPHLSPELVV